MLTQFGAILRSQMDVLSHPPEALAKSAAALNFAGVLDKLSLLLLLLLLLRFGRQRWRWRRSLVGRVGDAVNQVL